MASFREVDVRGQPEASQTSPEAVGYEPSIVIAVGIRSVFAIGVYRSMSAELVVSETTKE